MMGQVSSKAVLPLAILGDERAAQVPDVPTVIQSGVANFDVKKKLFELNVQAKGSTPESWGEVITKAGVPRL